MPRKIYAMEHGALFITLNTMDWEALAFYQNWNILLNLPEKVTKKVQGQPTLGALLSGFVLEK